MFWRAVLWLLLGLGVQTAASLMPTVTELLYSQYFYYYLVRWMSVHVPNQRTMRPLASRIGSARPRNQR